MPIIRDFNKDLVPMDNPIEARKNDLIRITEWLASPAGLKFAGKQALLRTTGNLDSFSRTDIQKAAEATRRGEVFSGVRQAGFRTNIEQARINARSARFATRSYRQQALLGAGTSLYSGVQKAGG